MYVGAVCGKKDKLCLLTGLAMPVRWGGLKVWGVGVRVGMEWAGVKEVWWWRCHPERGSRPEM